MSRQNTGCGWSATQTTAPVADPTLITRAYSEGLEPGQKLGNLFQNPSARAKAFIESLAPRARAGLENAARDGK